MIKYPDIRTFKFNMVDEQGNANYFKLDFSPEGDVYWFLGDSGYKISFHKSGKVHMKNNYDKTFYEPIDFDLFPSESHFSFVSNYSQNNSVIPEGRDVYAWPIPIEQLNTTSLVESFYTIQGRKATVTVSDKGILSTMTSLSPYLYETKDTKISSLVDTYKNCVILDTDGQIYMAGSNGILNLPNLSNFSVNTFYKMLGPWGRVLELMGEHMDVNADKDELEDDLDEEDSLFADMEIKKL
ncbi:MAG: hypothetical protein WAN47_08545 [Nitrosotalea sp.]